MLEKLDLERAYSRTRPWVNETPVITGTFLDELLGARVYLKCEQLQPVGAFKIRGAANFVLQLSEAQRKKGLVTHSSGNHAQAIAYVAHKMKIPSWIVMPEGSNALKVQMARKWGANVQFCAPTIQDRISTANALVNKHGGTLVPPYDHEWIIQGQSTCVMELLRKKPNIDVIISPLGGGGLLSGSILAAEYFGTQVEVFGVEPSQAADGLKGIKSGNRVESHNPSTLADGLRTTVGKKNFKVIQSKVNDIWTCSEDELVFWIYEAWKQLKMIIEPSSAVVFAAAQAQKNKLRGKKVGLVITGGNVDLSQLPKI